ncbi:aromatic acid exporter family protein [Staphylospora marina]|uniref:aromatic acid exporter family protein n=1 Tax=Staphylospora marina TaxID=2490858 RepID=UPI000F5C13C7|nr:aromatic acid exporter family protein [Staphylospora marina]
MKIGVRAIKTAVGTALSIAVAEWLGLRFYVSAGMITILVIQPSRRRSLQTAWERLVACLLGIALSGLVFESIGYHPMAITLLLLALIPISLAIKAKEGMVAAAVIVFHFYSLKTFNWDVVLNELALVGIGIGFGMLVNFWMPRLDKELKAYQEKIEANFRNILREFAAYLRQPDRHWDGRELVETARLLQEAKELALRDYENRLHHTESDFYRYFEMRQRQFEILVRIAPSVSSIQSCCVQGEVVAGFLERLAEAVHPGNTASVFLEELENIRKKFRASPLPATREEFETRASLLYFVKEMRRYLIIKRDLRKQLALEEEKEKEKDPLFVAERLARKWKRAVMGR